MFSDRFIKATNNTDFELLNYLRAWLNQDIKKNEQEAQNLFNYAINFHQFETYLFLFVQHRDNYIKLQERVEEIIYIKKKGNKTYTVRDDEAGQVGQNAYWAIENYINNEIDPKIDKLEQRIGDREQYSLRAASARDYVHFPDDNTLAEKKTFILEATKRKQTAEEVIAMLKEQQRYNDIVLDDDTCLYYRYLNGRENTFELEKEDETLKAFSDLSSRHLEYSHFLKAQLELFIAPQEKKPTTTVEQDIANGKPWKENYEAVVNIYTKFKGHLPTLLEKGYIIDENKATLTWTPDKNKASKADLGRYFKRITPDKFPTLWQEVKTLFGIKANVNFKSMIEKTPGSKTFNELCKLLNI